MSKLTKLRSASYAPLGEWAYQEIATLRAQLAEANAEILEQARLNGMGSEREAKLMAQLAEVTMELKVLSDFCEGAEDRSLLHKGGLKCLVDAVQKQSDNYARALAAGSKRIAEIHQIEQQLAEVTRERDAARSEAQCRSWEIVEKQSQLLATQANAARIENALEIIAGRRQCIDNLLSNVDIANAALSTPINLDALHALQAKAARWDHLDGAVDVSPYLREYHSGVCLSVDAIDAHRAKEGK